MAIPPHILLAVPASPFGFDVGIFADRADAAVARGPTSPSDTLAAEALPEGGTVLDVGAGAGAAGLVHAARAGRLVAVDTGDELLAAFSARAQRLGVASSVVAGRWPDVAPVAGRADVVVCHDVTYNAPDLAAFATALDRAATGRVVVQMTAEHPLAWQAPLWEALHGWRRPPGPTADDAAAVLQELDIRARVVRWQLDGWSSAGDDRGLPRTARMLCVGPDRHEHLAELLRVSQPPSPREVVTLWWDVADPYWNP